MKISMREMVWIALRDLHEISLEDLLRINSWEWTIENESWSKWTSSCYWLLFWSIIFLFLSLELKIDLIRVLSRQWIRISTWANCRVFTARAGLVSGRGLKAWAKIWFENFYQILIFPKLNSFSWYLIKNTSQMLFLCKTMVQNCLLYLKLSIIVVFVQGEL